MRLNGATSFDLVYDFNDGPYVAVAAGERFGLGLKADGSLKPYGARLFDDEIPTEPGDYFAIAAGPEDSVIAIRRVSE
jgi:hypothetical protein